VDNDDNGGSNPLIDVTGVNVDLTGLDKLEGVFNNLIAAIRSGVGAYYEPIKRVRDARADRTIANERAQTILDLTKKAGELDELQRKYGITADALQQSQGARALSYLFEQNLRKQDNREKVVEAVAVELTQSPPKSDTVRKIEDDWLAEYWRLAENTSREDVQNFFARLLVKEISKPGSISPITLRVLSTLTPHIAARFEHFCRLSIREDNDVFVIHPNVYSFQNIGPLEAFGISYEDLYELESFGLLRSAETIMLNFAKDQPDAQIDYAGKRAKLNFSGLQLHQLKLTRAGAEIRDLLYLQPIPEYTDALTAKLKGTFSIVE
jgi:hypothetical protein